MNRNALSTLRIIAITLFGIIIIGYSLFQGSKLLTGPVIEVTTPQNGETFSQTLIEVTGKARNISYINLNDRPIFTDKDGNFKEKLLLSPGYNIIKLDAKDKFKKYTEERLEVILKGY